MAGVPIYPLRALASRCPTASCVPRCIALDCKAPCRTKRVEIDVLCRKNKKRKHKKCCRRPRCGEIDIIIINQTPCISQSSPQTCGIGCAALSTELLALISAFVPGVSTPTAAAIATFVTDATTYLTCRISSGAAGAPDVLALTALLTALAAAANVWSAQIQALAFVAYSALIEVCRRRRCKKKKSNCCKCGERCRCEAKHGHCDCSE